jgi:hypothetical protein
MLGPTASTSVATREEMSSACTVISVSNTATRIRPLLCCHNEPRLVVASRHCRPGVAKVANLTTLRSPGSRAARTMALWRWSPTTLVLAIGTVAPHQSCLATPAGPAGGGGQGQMCGAWAAGVGFGPNMPGNFARFAATAADCCEFCHSTPGCHYWCVSLQCARLARGR